MATREESAPSFNFDRPVVRRVEGSPHAALAPGRIGLHLTLGEFWDDEALERKAHEPVCSEAQSEPDRA